MLTLIEKFPNSNYKEYAVKDLGFLATKVHAVSRIRSLGRKFFKSKQDYKNFLLSANTNLDSKVSYRDKKTLIKEILKYEKDPKQRASLLLENLSAAARGVASTAHYKEYVSVVEIIDKLNLMKSTPTIREAMYQQSQSILKSYIETFAGRVKTPERITKDEMGKRSIVLFGIYDKYFYNKPLSQEVYPLWLELCSELKDLKCLKQLVAMSSRNQFLKAKDRSLKLSLIDALEHKYKNSKTFHKPLFKELLSYHKSYPQSKNWELITNRAIELAKENRSNKLAQQLAEKLYQRRPSEKNLYHLSLLRFENKQYRKIVDQGYSVKKYPKSIRLKEVYQNSLLKLADKSTQTGDLSKLKHLVQQYVSTNPSRDKVIIVKNQYIQQLLKNKKFSEADRHFSQYTISEKRSTEGRALQGRLLDYYLLEGQFVKAFRLFKGQSFTSLDKDSRYWFLLLSLANRSYNNFSKYVEQLNSQQKTYLLSVLTLSVPQQALSFFTKQKRLDTSERKLYLLATRLVQNRWDVSKTRSLASKLGDLAPRSWSYSSSHSLRKLISQIHLPYGVRNSQDLNVKIKQEAQKLQLLRKEVAKRVAGLSPADKISVIEQAQTLETGMAQIIQKSPLPPNLNAQEQQQYQQGLANLAQEYVQQAAEYQKLKTSFSEQNTQSKAQALALLSPQRWPWKKSFFKKYDKANRLRSWASRNELSKALLYLDLVKDKAKLSSFDYENQRVGLLSIANSSLVMRDPPLQ